MMIYVTEDRGVECEVLRVRSKLITAAGGREGVRVQDGSFIMAGEFTECVCRMGKSWYPVPAPIYPTPNRVNI